MTIAWRVRLARIALGWAVLASLIFAGSIPWRDPTRAELIAILACMAVAVASLVGALTLRRRSSFGRWLVVLLGIYGTARLVIVLRTAVSIDPREMHEVFIVGLIVLGSLFGALMLAALLILSFRHQWPGTHDLSRATPSYDADSIQHNAR